MTLLYRPEVPHRCKPHTDKITVRGTEGSAVYDSVPPIGTIWRCECGQLWEVKPTQPGIIGNRWAEAGWWTQFRVWWMLRKSKVGNNDTKQ